MFLGNKLDSDMANSGLCCVLHSHGLHVIRDCDDKDVFECPHVEVNEG